MDMMAAETTARQQRGKPFAPGSSGNPAGRPVGARHKTTLAMEALLDGEHEALTRKAIDMAKGGDSVALRMCLDRLMPPRKDRHIAFDLPKLETPADAVKASASIVYAVAHGELTPSEAAELSKVVDGFTRAVETADLASRIEKLEKQQTRS
jgi:hypothetical protein